MKLRLAFALLVLTASLRPAGAQTLVADLSDPSVEITTGFVGANVILFGAAESEGDIVVTVRGPRRDTVIRQKSHLAGIWLNDRSAEFAGVPGYYATLSSRPLAELLSPDKLAKAGIGVESLHFAATESADPGETAAFRAAMIDAFQREGLYATRSGAFVFRGKHLFRTTLTFPASVPAGTYAIEVHLVRQGEIAATQRLALTIEPSGFEAAINDFAVGHEILYGMVVVLLAAMAGWLGSTVLRGAQ
jgi:uncharacterized protein (TIGR02186 family)